MCVPCIALAAIASVAEERNEPVFFASSGDGGRCLASRGYVAGAV